jgi:hypothetical protein
MGRLKGIQYFDTNKDKRLTWFAPLFNDVKWGASKGKAASHPGRFVSSSKRTFDEL